MLTIRRLAQATLFAIIASAIAVSPAKAQPDQHVAIHETFSGTFPLCLTTMNYDQTVDGQSLLDTHPDGTVFMIFQSRINTLWTNPDTGGTLTEKTILNANSRLTPTADGTTSVDIIPQNDQWFDSDGNLVGHLAGIVRAVVVFDQSGALISITLVENGNFSNPIDTCTLVELTE